MARKPTYEELEKRVKELEEESLEVKRMDKALRESEERLKGFMQSATDAFSLYDSELNFVEINETGMKYFPPGTTKEDVVGKNVLEWAPNLKPTGRYDKYLEIIKTGKPFFADEVVVDPKLGARYVSVKAFKVGDGLGIVGSNITDQKRAQEALRESEEKYRTLFENASEAILVAQDEVIKFANPKAEELYGYSKEELASRPFTDFVHEEDREMVGERYKRRIRGEALPSIYPFRIINKAGDIKWIEFNGSKFSWDNRPATLCFMTDITEGKLAQEALRERETELEIKTNSLEEVNTALRVLLESRDEDKIQLEEKVLANVKNLVFPYVEKVKKQLKDERIKAYLNVLETNLNAIISPFSRKISSKYLNFTTAEIEVANLVKLGKSTKEIAAMLDLSHKTIETHRANVRKKLGITNKRANLRTYLSSID